TIALVHEVVLGGTVLDEDGTPLSNALVVAETEGIVDDKPGRVSASETLSDDQGRFRLSQLAPGDYWVSAMAPAFVDAGGAGAAAPSYAPTYFPGTLDVRQATRIRLASGAAPAPLAITVQLAAAP